MRSRRPVSTYLIYFNIRYCIYVYVYVFAYFNMKKSLELMPKLNFMQMHECKEKVTKTYHNLKIIICIGFISLLKKYVHMCL